VKSAKPVLTLVAGPNGSGKTRLSLELIAEDWIEESTYVNADQIAQDRFGGWNNPTARQRATVLAASLIKANLKSKTSFAVETVLSPSGLALLRRAQNLGFITRLYFIGTSDPAINIRRVHARSLRGGHDIPETTVVRRYLEAVGSLPAALAMADYSVVIDNSNEDQVFLELYEASRGRLLRRLADDTPHWAADGLASLRTKDFD
jgi:predicted ABC-type ATPase